MSSSAWPARQGPVVASDRLHAGLRRPDPSLSCRGRYRVLGTDGFGRSDYRRKLRAFFEVDRHFVALAALKALARRGHDRRDARPAEAIRSSASTRRSRTRLTRLSAGDRRRQIAGERRGASEVTVPDIGDFKDVPIIEIHVKRGRRGQRRGPADHARIRQGDDGRAGAARAARSRSCWSRSATGSARARPILKLRGNEDGRADASRPRCCRSRSRRRSRSRPPSPAPAARRRAAPPAPAARQTSPASTRAPACAASRASSASISTKLKGTGEKGRITKEDVLAFLRGPAPHRRPPPAAPPPARAFPRSRRRTSPSSARSRPSRSSRIKRISGPHLHRAWLNIPHVTQHDEADITETRRLPQGARRGRRRRRATASPCSPSC